LNQRDELTIDGGSSLASSGFSAPEQAKAKAMPGNDGLGLEEQQGLLPVKPNAPQANPKQSVGGAEFGFGGLAFEHGELMPEGQILEHESGMGLEVSEQAAPKQQKELEHEGPTLVDNTEKSTFSTAHGVFATHTALRPADLGLWSCSPVVPVSCAKPSPQLPSLFSFQSYTGSFTGPESVWGD
jgi:hypothetical protein